MPRCLYKLFCCNKCSRNQIAVDNYDDEIFDTRLGKSIQNSFKKFLRKKRFLKIILVNYYFFLEDLFFLGDSFFLGDLVFFLDLDLLVHLP